jgi:hypothetical protein
MVFSRFAYLVERFRRFFTLFFEEFCRIVGWEAQILLGL